MWMIGLDANSGPFFIRVNRVLSAGVRNSEPGQLAAEAGMRLASVSL